MSDFSQIDKNFLIKTKIEKEDVCFHNASVFPFEVFGLIRENGRFCRMLETVSASVSDGVHRLHGNTAGGRVRFATDSSYVAIQAEMDGITKTSTFTFAGSSGFDLYADNIYAGTFAPPLNMESDYESVVELGEGGLREITINFPLYSNVRELYIGLQKDCVVNQAKPYVNDKPVVFYGSSITQGGCASRPGMCYQAMVSRRLNLDYVNLGFAGNAKAEDEMAHYISDLDMSAFVFDYDHNSTSAEYLWETHEKFFRTVRKSHPDIPILIMTAPVYKANSDWLKRWEALEATYKNAVSEGDKNVCFLSGDELFAMCGYDGTVDGCHPNDFGFASMANAVGNILEKVFKL